MSINYFNDTELEDEFRRIYNVSHQDFYYSAVYEGMKVRQRFLCWKYLPMLRDRYIFEDDVAVDSELEAVFLEFRWFPHIEFIIRNAIIILGKKWSHTIVCGNKNHEEMRKMCEKINPKIKIIQLPIDGLDPLDTEGRNPETSYNGLLTSEKFWNLFKGEKILIHQEDSCIFKSNYEDFLKFDYIGAPWDESHSWWEESGLIMPVGNGGFSLRTRKIMLEIIQRFERSPDDNEDVYFSRMMQEHGIGVLADDYDAGQFSSEGLVVKHSFGGHCYFNYDVESEKRFVNECVLSIYKGETMTHVQMRPVQPFYV